jgi:hypothetical protein
MKTTELIKKLQALVHANGDSDLRFTVQDAYSTYGQEMRIHLKVGDTDGMSSDYFGFAHNSDANLTTLKFYLDNDTDNKKPKITFRK